MRIAMFSWESLHSIAVGGVAAHVTELAAALACEGHEVHVFTRMAPRQPYHEYLEGVHYHRCAYEGQRELVDDVNNMCRALVDRFFAMEDYVGTFDIIHAHDWLAANALIWIKQGRPGHRGVLTIHSTEYARCGNVHSNGRSNRIRMQERAGTQWADHVIAVSQATRGEIQSIYGVPEGKTSAIYNGVTPERFDVVVDGGEFKRGQGWAPLDPTVLFCGQLAWQKGPDLLLEAIPGVLRVCPEAKFMFVGEGDMRNGLEGRARQLRIGHAVRFLGHRVDRDLAAVYKVADVLCVPSRNEPFGIVVLEAWSAGKPVVVSQVGGPSEYVTHEVNGLKIHPRAESVAWGLQFMFSDFERARTMGGRGREEVEAQFHLGQDQPADGGGL